MERSGPTWSLAGLLAALLVCTCVGGVCGRTGGCLQGSQNISSLLETTTTITLKHGNYCVERFVQIVNKRSFSLSSDSGNPNDVVIRCADGVGVGFHNISDQLMLSGVTISGCGMVNDTLNVFLDSINETLNMYYTALANTSVAIVIAASHNVTLSDMRVSNNIGFGLLAVSLYGNNTFFNVEFSQNAPLGCRVPLETPHAGNSLGGGVVFQFHDWRTNSNEMGNVTVVIENSHFSNNTNYYSTDIVTSYMEFSPTLQEIGYTLSGAAGITVKLCQLHYSVDFVVRNSSINGNKALNAGGAAISTFRNVMNSQISFFDCSFNDNVYSISNVTSIGMGLTLSLDLWYWNSISETRSDVSLLFDSCAFVGNVASTGGAVYVTYSPAIASELLENIVFKNCLFHQNSASAGSAVTVHTYESGAISPSHRLTFDGCEFSSNTVTAPSTVSASLLGAGTIQIKNALIELKDAIIKDTNGSGIQCVDSTVIVSGNVTFSNNSAVYGGGAQMIGYSYFVATNHSKLIFRRNTAYQTGGGIYYTLPQNAILTSSFDCFLYFNSFDPLCIRNCAFLDLDFVLSFEDNTAPLGTMIYGALLDTCVWSYILSEPFGPGGVDKSHTIELLNTYYNDTFQFDQPLRPKGVNTNAVDPMVKVKLNNSSTLSVMPGEQFAVTGNATDLLGNTVSDVMLAVIDNQKYVNNTPTTHATVGSDGLWRISGNSESSIRVSGPRNFTAVVSVTSSLSHASSSLNVQLTNCRPGFHYNSTTYQCECDELLLNKDYIRDNFRCNAINGSFLVRNGYWFGNLNGGSTLNYNVNQYVLSLCGSFYCDNPLYRTHQSGRQPVSLPVGVFQYVDPDDLDTQCLANRTGLLCGQCKEGFSVVLGTLRCEECTNNFGIFFIILFAALGILLMCVVTISDFHVSGGYINGLILYSNIIDIYYHELVKRNIPYSILVVYEWLSLRWGIPVCFYQGLDPLAQAGLEFVFPIYMGLLLIITALVARYCPIPQRYRNAINLPKMFATMLFLTFGAVLGSSIRILSFVVVYTASGPLSWSVRWRGDPNILYFQDVRHIILAVMSIVAIAYLIGTTTLLIIPEKFCRLTWCKRQQRKWKPISDVFQAPFRKPYFCRTWEGWRLLFRVLVICVGFFPISVHLWVLLLILLIFHFIQSALHPHARQIRNWLDSYFILMLLVTFFFYIGLDAFNISSNDVIFLVPFYLLQAAVFISMIIIFVKCFSRCLKKLYGILRKCFGKKEGAKRFSQSNTMLDSSTLIQNGEDAEQDEPPGETVLQVTESDVGVKNYGSLRPSLLLYDSDQEEEEMTNVSQ